MKGKERIQSMPEFFIGLLNTLRTLSNYTVPFMAICAFLAYVIKPVRSRISKAVKKISNTEEIKMDIEEIKVKFDMLLKNDNERAEQLKIHESVHLSALKNRIVNLYFKYINSEYLPSFEKQNLVEQYELYKKLGGNSYFDTLYATLMKKRETAPGNEE
jgi:hypothetical protein